MAAIFVVLLALAGQPDSPKQPATPLSPTTEPFPTGPLDTPDRFQDNDTADNDSSRYYHPSDQQRGREITPEVKAAEAERLAEIWATAKPGHGG